LVDSSAVSAVINSNSLDEELVISGIGDLSRCEVR
jgi:hypothetical protein